MELACLMQKVSWSILLFANFHHMFMLWPKMITLRGTLQYIHFEFTLLLFPSSVDSVLCDLFPSNRVPRFFRVSKQDESSFPPSTFENLGLEEVSIVSDNSISVKWHLQLGFYYSDYDWGLIFRRIGDVDNPNMFYKTRSAQCFNSKSSPLFCYLFCVEWNYRRIR